MSFRVTGQGNKVYSAIIFRDCPHCENHRPHPYTVGGSNLLGDKPSLTKADLSTVQALFTERLKVKGSIEARCVGHARTPDGKLGDLVYADVARVNFTRGRDSVTILAELVDITAISAL